MEQIDFKRVTEDAIKWIHDWFEVNGNGCNAIIGESGGKDSLIVSKLCVEALGKDRVIGVAMPDINQGINDADKICEYLGIKYMCIPIGEMTNSFKGVWHDLGDEDFKWSNQAIQNIPPRIRMTTLYALSQTLNGRVMGTCNASENYIGYFTRYGDGASDVEPLGNFTVKRVKEIGYQLGIPKKWVDKVPDDGLPFSQPDDEKFMKMGFNYEKLDNYIENGTSGDEKADEAIEKMHEKNKFKMGLGTMY